jgi:MFS family permease
MCLLGGVVAVGSSFLSGWWAYAGLCVCGSLVGGGANVGLIAVQRTAGKLASDAVERKQIFSWIGLAPALSNVVGPLVAGFAIDHAGYAIAFALLSLMPLAAIVCAHRVPHEVVGPHAATSGAGGFRDAWRLLNSPAMRRLLFVNWLISTSWDMHSFLVPVLGHERALSASAIGSILGAFALAVALVRLLIPTLAHRLSEGQVLMGSMLIVAAVFAIYPFAHVAAAMGACAVVLGLALGCVQPMIMSTLHHITPEHRHGQSIALRSMAINLSSAVMPLSFGVLGTALGASGLFWLMGAAVGAGSGLARKLGQGAPARESAFG